MSGQDTLSRRDVLWECYGALFSGMPVGLLMEWRRFVWDHDRDWIRSLSAFCDDFDDVMQIFQAHNFAGEYARRYPHENFGDGAFRDVAAPRPAHSPAECEARLRALRSAIAHVGAGTVEAEVLRLCELYAGADREAEILQYVLRTARQHTGTAGVAGPARRGAGMPATAAMWGLLGRLEALG